MPYPLDCLLNPRHADGVADNNEVTQASLLSQLNLVFEQGFTEKIKEKFILGQREHAFACSAAQKQGFHNHIMTEIMDSVSGKTLSLL
jgi:hypothetical protein